MSPRFAVQSLAPRMHIVIVGWLFIAFTMALTMRPLAGAFFFVFAGLVPVLLYAALALRRRRAVRAAPPPAHAPEARPTPTAPAPRARSR